MVATAEVPHRTPAAPGPRVIDKRTQFRARFGRDAGPWPSPNVPGGGGDGVIVPASSCAARSNDRRPRVPGLLAREVGNLEIEACDDPVRVRDALCAPLHVLDALGHKPDP